MQAKINRLEAKQGAEISPHLEAESAAFQSTVEDHDARLTQLELSQTDCTCNDTIRLHDYDTMITHLEADNADNGEAIQHLGAKTARLTTVTTECEEQMQIINNTMEQLWQGIYTNEGRIAMERTKIEQIELDSDSDRPEPDPNTSTRRYGKARKFN